MKTAFNLVITLMLSLGILGCRKETKEEPVPAKIKELISSYKTCTCEPFIKEYSWKDQTVYVSSCGGPACDCITLYYDKDGNAINSMESQNFNSFGQEAKFIRTVWSCKAQ